MRIACNIFLFMMTLAWCYSVTAQQQISGTQELDRTQVIETPQTAVNTNETQRRALADAALNALSKKVMSREGLDHPGRIAGYTVTYAMAGLAFLAADADIKKGKYRRELIKIAKYLRNSTGAIPMSARGKVQDLTTWGYASSIMFYAELLAHNKHRIYERILQEQVDQLAKRQSDNGGWLHGAQVQEMIKYKELTALTLWCATALGMAKKSGAELDQAVLTRALDYIEQCTNSNGTLGYSPELKKHVQPGRNAGALLMLQVLEKRDSPLYQGYRKFAYSHLMRLPRGHGSPLMHFFWAATASWADGDEAWQAFWEMYGPGIQHRAAKNGHIQMPVAHPYEGKDRATAIQALILLLPENNLKRFAFRPGP